MSEILTAIKLVKMYAWEKSFANKVSDLRAREVKEIWKLAILKAVNLTFVFASPALVCIIVFGRIFVYVVGLIVKLCTSS